MQRLLDADADQPRHDLRIGVSPRRTLRADDGLAAQSRLALRPDDVAELLGNTGRPQRNQITITIDEQRRHPVAQFPDRIITRLLPLADHLKSMSGRLPERGDRLHHFLAQRRHLATHLSRHGLDPARRSLPPFFRPRFRPRRLRGFVRHPLLGG
jgi:hypothetical protein